MAGPSAPARSVRRLLAPAARSRRGSGRTPHAACRCARPVDSNAAGPHTVGSAAAQGARSCRAVCMACLEQRAVALCGGLLLCAQLGRLLRVAAQDTPTRTYWRPVVLIASLTHTDCARAGATLCEARMHTLRRQGKRSNRFRRSGDMSFRCKWSVLRDGRVAGAFAAALAGPAGALEAGVVARAVGRGAAAAPSAGCTQERSKDECNALSACRVVRNAPGSPSDRSADGRSRTDQRVHSTCGTPAGSH